MIQKCSNRYLVIIAKKLPALPKKGKSRECVFSSFCVRRFAVRKKATVKALFQQVCRFLLLSGAQCLHQPGRFDQLPADILHDLHRDAVPVIRGQQHQCPQHDAPRLIDRRLCLQIAKRQSFTALVLQWSSRAYRDLM